VGETFCLRRGKKEEKNKRKRPGASGVNGGRQKRKIKKIKKKVKRRGKWEYVAWGMEEEKKGEK
jgi:hypothetical protein